MARILLINSNRFKHPWPVMPFGLVCVAGVLERAGHKVTVLDLCFSQDTAGAIKKAVKEERPSIIGISIRNIDNIAPRNNIFLLDDVKKDVIEPCKKLFRGPIIIGGPAVGINGVEMLKFFDLEYAVRGDGEACIEEFVRRVEGKLMAPDR